MDPFALEEEHICPRREQNELAPPRQEVLHCYGVDFLSTKEVLKVFSEWQPTEVEWLDDSSCNLIFPSPEDAQKAMRELALGDATGPWTRTRPLSVTATDQKKKARAPKNFRLQLRIANEADRKDPGHSGHTDSIYYAHVKEQQALEKQATELRRMKKRQRQMAPRYKEAKTDWNAAPQESQESRESQKGGVRESREGADGAQASSAAPKAAPMHSGSILSMRLASCGLLDPLLFLKAPPGRAKEAPKPGEAVPSAPDEDLKASMKRAEAEYAAVLPKSTAKGRGRGQKEGARKESRGAGQKDQRGKKRRPVEQEPRPVSEATPPQRQAQLIPEIEAFLKKHGVRYKRFVLQRSFRSIRYAQQEAAKTKAMALKQKQKGENKDEDEVKEVPLPPIQQREEPSSWDAYMKANANFISAGIFMQTRAWKVEGRRVLSVVPHPLMTDREKVAKAVQKPISSVQACKLKDISQETGFPVFVCPPFGYPPDADGRPPLLLVDSAVVDKKRPLLFDCGSIGISLAVSEFLRSTRAACVENLATEKELDSKAELAGAASPEPAPEPAPIIGEGEDMKM